jgi:hypothetical protein
LTPLWYAIIVEPENLTQKKEETMIAKPLKTVVILLILATLFASTAAAQEDLMSLVQAYHDSWNRGDVDAHMALYADDAECEIVGYGSLVGQEQIRGYKEYYAALNVDVQFSDCTVEGNTVTCQLSRHDDVLRKAAAGPVSISAVFTVEGGLIQKHVGALLEESAPAYYQTSGAFIGWVKENRPEAMAKLFTPEGQFVFSGETGELVASLVKEWTPSAPAMLPTTGGTTPTGTLPLWLVGGLLLLALGLGLRRASGRAR